MKHILYYIGVLGSGGIESTTISVFKHIDRSVIAIDFIVDSPEFVTNKSYECIIKERGGRIYFLSEYSRGSVDSKLSKMIAFGRLFRENHCQAVHFHVSYPSSLMYALAARMSGIKRIYSTSHAKSTMCTNHLFIWSQRVSKSILPFFVSKRFAVSEEAGKWCYGSLSFQIIPNGVEVSRFKFNSSKRKEVRVELNIPSDFLLIGHIGRFVKDKNQEFVINVFAEYHKNNPKSKLLLIGEGNLKQYIKEECTKLGINENVVFLPFTSSPENYLWAMDLFLFPSLAEGFGMAALEAQAASLPVIASENVPLKTKVSELITYLPLDAKLWGRELDGFRQYNRDSIDLKGLKPYDAQLISKTFEEVYKR